MTSLKILLSAYACEPNKGSEPGVGWEVANQMAKYHEVWVITRANNRSTIEGATEEGSCSNLHFLYYDLPGWLKWWKKGQGGVQLYYYLWQLGIQGVARRLHAQVQFDVVHHVTFGRYWSPSLLSLLPVPFIWGPVGGGESAPKTFWKSFGTKGRIFEFFRNLARWLGEHDPLLRLTARKCVLGLATTNETAQRLRKLGCKDVRVMAQCSMDVALLSKLSVLAIVTDEPFRFISIGRPIHWKGFHLGMRAFAQAQLKNAEYWFIVNGPEQKGFTRLAKELDITRSVRFIKKLPSLDDVYSVLGQCHVLVHPALHEAFGNVVLEAMAAGRPVICLDLGGPANQVTEDTGFKIPAHSPEQVVREMAKVMRGLVSNVMLVEQMGQAARRRVTREYTWEYTSKLLNNLYLQVADKKDI